MSSSVRRIKQFHHYVVRAHSLDELMNLLPRTCRLVAVLKDAAVSERVYPPTVEFVFFGICEEEWEIAEEVRE